MEREGNYERVAEIRYSKLVALEDDIKKIQEQLKSTQGGEAMIREEVTADDIAEVVSRWTGIPVSRMMQSEREKLLHLEEELHKRVIGQDEAITAVSDAVRRSRAGLHTLAPWIESGQLMVISIDTLDQETWSDTSGDPYWRIRRYEQWLHYIVEEAVPKIQYLAKERNGWEDMPGVIAFGCSLGATHAVNLYLRRPDVFCGCIALSGIYTAHYGFGDYMDELVYMNSPVDYMRNFPEDHPYMELYRSQKAVICCGQGAWEQPDTTWMLKRILEAKHIPIWVDLWGHDVEHDWEWWYKQVVYYMPFVLGQQ